MSFSPVIFLLARWAGVAAIILMALPGLAQQTIQFTKPADKDLPAKAKDFVPSPTRRSSPDAFNAPASLFGDQTATVSFDVLPGGPNQSPVPSATAAQWRRFLDGRKNWMFMKPEEVLNIRTPEQIMGIADPKNDPSLSAEERFLQRQDRRAAAGATNGMGRPDASLWRNDSPTDLFRPVDAPVRFAQTLGGSIPAAEKKLNSLFNSNPDPPTDVKPRPDSVWSSPFGMPDPLPKLTPDQLAGMDRFRALMEPGAPEKAPEAAHFSLPQAATPDRSLLALPAYNPSGRSFSVLESGMAKPTGITPLPGITGPRQAPATKPAPLVQAPPWLQDSPGAFTPLQRRY